MPHCGWLGDLIAEIIRNEWKVLRRRRHGTAITQMMHSEVKTLRGLVILQVRVFF